MKTIICYLFIMKDKEKSNEEVKIYFEFWKRMQPKKDWLQLTRKKEKLSRYIDVG